MNISFDICRPLKMNVDIESYLHSFLDEEFLRRKKRCFRSPFNCKHRRSAACKKLSKREMMVFSCIFVSFKINNKLKTFFHLILIANFSKVHFHSFLEKSTFWTQGISFWEHIEV